MTLPTFKTLQPLFLLSFLLVSLSGCLKDTCKQTYTYQIYKPVYMGYEVLRSSVKSLPPTDMKTVGKIYYKTPYIFINEVDKGIHVIDNTNPSSPQNVAFINIPGNIDVAVKDNILYADSYVDMVAIDISNPLSATEVYREQNVFPNRVYTNGWVADATKGVVIDWVEGDTSIVQDCAMQYALAYFDNVFTAGTTGINSSGGGSANTVTPGIGVAGSLARFAISNDFLYCLDDASMKLFDIANAAHPLQNSSVTMPWNIETIFPYNNYLFIGTTTGIYIYENSNAASPEYISQLVHVSSCDPVVVNGNYAYATLHNGTPCGGFTNECDVIDISNIHSPTLKNTVSLTHPFGLGIDDKKLFICDDNSGLKWFDISDPLQISLQETFSANETRDVIPLGNLLLMIATDGLYQFDYSSGNLVQLSYLPISK